MNTKELYKSIMSAKCAAHLTQGRKQLKQHINKEIFEKSAIDREGLIKHQIKERLAHELINDVNQQIKKESLPNGDCLYEIDLMVLPTNVFFDVVNHVVQTLSIEQIYQIKNKDV